MNTPPLPLGSSADDSALEQWLHEWWAQAGQSEPVAERMRHLMESIQQSEASLDDPLCDEFEPMIEAYVDDVSRGKPLASYYTLLQSHLQVCDECSEKVEWLLDAVAGAIAHSPRLSAFKTPDLATPRNDTFAPWRVMPFRAEPQRRRGFEIRFNPAFIVQRYQTPSTLVIRNAAAERHKTLLMAEQLFIEQQQWNITIQSAFDPTDTTRLSLCAEIVSDGRLPLHVTLQWADQRFTGDTDTEGRICFESLLAAVVRQLNPQIVLDIQVIEPPSTL